MSGFSPIKGVRRTDFVKFRKPVGPAPSFPRSSVAPSLSCPVPSDRKFRVGGKRFSREQDFGHQVVMQRGTDGDRGGEGGVQL